MNMGTWGCGPYDSDAGLDAVNMLMHAESIFEKETLLLSFLTSRNESETWFAIGLIAHTLGMKRNYLDESYATHYDEIIPRSVALNVLDEAIVGSGKLLHDKVWLKTWVDGGLQVAEEIRETLMFLTGKPSPE